MCAKNSKHTKESLSKAIDKNNPYNYEYELPDKIGSRMSIRFFCKEHGWFEKSCPQQSVVRCPKCFGITSVKYDEDGNIVQRDVLNSETLSRLIIDKHGDKYDCSEIDYKNIDTKVKIVCKEHGPFWQTPYNLMHGGIGCCGCRYKKISDKTRSDKEHVIELFRKKHGDKYDYDDIDYVNNTTKIAINCHKHGVFFQTPSNHIQGAGCPICHESRLETQVRVFLEEENISFESQKRFPWLKTDKGSMSLDFYIKDHNIAIECQGIQHFKPLEHFGGEEVLKIQKERDRLKKALCEEHGITVIYLADKETLKESIDYDKELCFSRAEEIIDCLNNSKS